MEIFTGGTVFAQHQNGEFGDFLKGHLFCCLRKICGIGHKDILKDRELMDGAEFQELEQVEGGENDGVYMQAMRSTV